MKELFELTINQENDIELKNTCDGDILLSPATGGFFQGENFKGTLVPIGTGVTYTRQPGKNDISASMLLYTNDNAHILMDVNAYFDTEISIENRIMYGDIVNPEEYYYKGIVDFKTNDDSYRWLERKICVCDVILENWEKIRFKVYMI